MECNENLYTPFDIIDLSNKTIFLFGAGNGLEKIAYSFILRGIHSFEAVLDNSIDKNGSSLQDVFSDEFQKKYYSCFVNKQVCLPILLENYSKNDTYIIITSFNKQNASIIEKQLYEMGFCSVFSINNIDIHNLSVDNNKILLYSFGQYSEHPKYIAENLLVMDHKFQIVSIENNYFNYKVQKDCIINSIDINDAISVIYEYATSKVWLISTLVPSYIEKKESQIYIHTKHWASITLKRFYLDASTIADNDKAVTSWLNNFRMIDYIISGSTFDEETCRRGFAFNGRFIRLGSSRTDAMFAYKQCKNKICNYYGINEQTKILLYAPTYRFKRINNEKKVESMEIKLNYERLIFTLHNKFGGEWIIIERNHPLVSKRSLALPYNNKIDASEYFDGEEIVSASDILITDYSSIMFEPAFVHKPVFLFATDITDYIDKEYDLLLDYRSLPFPIAETNEQLAENIMNFDNEKYIRDVDSFMEKYDVHEDGHASERAAKFISDLIDGKVE